MNTFTSKEMNLMCLYNSGTRLELIDNLTDMRSYLQADETELLTLTDCVPVSYTHLDVYKRQGSR